MARVDELRLIARIAHMYFVEELKQTEIARRLSISQTSISRYLKRAQAEGIVRISVSVPRGTYPQLEAELRSRYGIDEAIVAECAEDREEQILTRVGEAAAHYLTTTLERDAVLGISSWSETLLRMVDSIVPSEAPRAREVVQILGGMGNPGVQAHATSLTVRLASLTHARPMLLTTQGVASSAAAKRALLEDTYVRETLAEYPSLTTALVGIGALEPSKLLADSGNVFTSIELATLDRLGAVGDVCLRFFDERGVSIASPFDGRVIGADLTTLRQVPRVIGVAGGDRKVAAIRGALAGSLIDVLITDRFTAAKILAAPVGL